MGVCGICNQCWCKVELLGLYNLKLEQEMRILVCGDQWILHVVTWLVLRRVEIEEISYWQKGSCLFWPCFWGKGGREGCETIGIAMYFIWGKNRKKKFFTSNSMEALTMFNEEHQGLLKLQFPLGWEWGSIEWWGGSSEAIPKGGAMEQVLDGGLLQLGGDSW